MISTSVGIMVVEVLEGSAKVGREERVSAATSMEGMGAEDELIEYGEGESAETVSARERERKKKGTTAAFALTSSGASPSVA
jgi:orotidine-5'-phosphate decarboxylase